MLTIFLLLPVALPVHAAVYTVADPGNDGLGSLREAILAANASPENDTINIGVNTITLTTALPTIANNGSLIIKGEGATITRDETAENFAIFRVDSGADVMLDDVLITNGAVRGSGGGIYNRGMLTISDSTISGNSAVYQTMDGGGGIYNAGTGTLIVINSTFIENAVTGFDTGGRQGGAIHNQGTATLIDTTFVGNAAQSGGGSIYNAGTMTVTRGGFYDNTSANGGAIVNFGFLTVTGSNFTGNTAEYGGGIANVATLEVVSSTFSENTATTTHPASGGGGIANAGIFSDLEIVNTTLYSNSATGGRGSGIHNGSGGTMTLINSTVSGDETGSVIYNTSSASVITLYNTIIVSDAGSSCVNSSGTIHAQHSLIEDDLTCVNGASIGNLIGDPNLGALTGNPAYFPLKMGSIALDAGSNALVANGIATDQRGNDRIANGTVDMGAYEAGVSMLFVQINLQGRPLKPDLAYAITVHVQLRDAGSMIPVFSQDFTSDVNGFFAFDGLVEGQYDIWIKGTHTLARLHNVTVMEGANVLNTEMLPEGDANDDNSVTLVDFSLLASSFGTAAGEPNYSAQADFNNDGRIQLSDFSLLASNYGDSGAP